MGMTCQSVSKHLDILETAELVTTLRRGREKLHFLNAAPINDIAERWIQQLRPDVGRGLVQSSKTALEATTPMGTAKRPDDLRLQHLHPGNARAGLAGPHRPRIHAAAYRRHPTAGWRVDGHRLAEGLDVRPDLRRGEPRHRGRRTGGPRVRSLPPIGLYLADVFLPEWANAALGLRGARRPPHPGAPSGARRRSPSTSRRPAPDVVKLTVVHDGFGQGSEVLKGVSSGMAGGAGQSQDPARDRLTAAVTRFRIPRVESQRRSSHIGHRHRVHLQSKAT